MDDLDREIEEAVRAARRRVWRGRLATIASTATFLLVAIVGSIAMFQLFPDVSDLDARLRAQKERGEEPSAKMIAVNLAVFQSDRVSIRWKLAPAMGLAFASALFVSKRLKPPNS